MTSPQSAPEPKNDWPIIAGRCQPADVRVIDIAASYAGQSRGDFLVQAAKERAEKVLSDIGVLEETRAAAS